MPDTIYKTTLLVTGLDKTPALEQYVAVKIGLLQKYLPHYGVESREPHFAVEIGKTTDHHRKGFVFRAEINFTAGPVALRSEAVHEDLYAAIDAAKDEMDRELRRHKGKHIDLLKRGGAKIKEFLRGWYRR